MDIQNHLKNQKYLGIVEMEIVKNNKKKNYGKNHKDAIS